MSFQYLWEKSLRVLFKFCYLSGSPYLPYRSEAEGQQKEGSGLSWEVTGMGWRHYQCLNPSTPCLPLCHTASTWTVLLEATPTPCTALSLLLYHLPIPVSPLELSACFTPTLYHRTFTQNLPGQPLGAPLNAGESAPWSVFPKDPPVAPMLCLAHWAKFGKKNNMGRIFTLFLLPTPTIIFSYQTTRKCQRSWTWMFLYEEGQKSCLKAGSKYGSRGGQRG